MTRVRDLKVGQIVFERLEYTDGTTKDVFHLVKSLPNGADCIPGIVALKVARPSDPSGSVVTAEFVAEQDVRILTRAECERRGWEFVGA